MAGDEQLYREAILEHYRSPKNRGSIENPDAHAESANPFCGDQLSVDLKVEKEKIVDFRFSGAGCAISIASASMSSSIVLGKKVSQVMHMGEKEVVGMLGMDPGAARIKCAMLSLETVKKALAERKK